ncbi:MAG: hypothetical protein M5U01_29550 [Ardenticatenaceae bacterium]|nr:hypothetical protein [Ardenticatenaceae bacterium]
MKHSELNFKLRVPQPEIRVNWCAWLPSRGTVLFTLLVVAGLLWAGSAGALPLAVPAGAATHMEMLSAHRMGGAEVRLERAGER